MVIKREHIDKAKEKVKMHSHALKSEFRKQTSTAIMAAFGLIIALAWKDVITSLVGMLKIGGTGTGALSLTITASILTLISVLGILLVSKWAKAGEGK